MSNKRVVLVQLSEDLVQELAISRRTRERAADSPNAGDMQRASIAEVATLRRLGLEVELWYASSKHLRGASGEAPTASEGSVEDGGLGGS